MSRYVALQQMLQRNMETTIMATLFNTVADVPAASPSSGLVDRMGRILSFIAERRARYVALRELQRLDQHVLRDLQISPLDFDAIARGTFRR